MRSADAIVFEVLVAQTRAIIRTHKEQAKHERVRALLAYLEANFLEPGLTIRKAAKACHIADNSFSAIFRHQVGQNPSVFLRQLRLRLVSDLLANTSFSIAIIAARVGYTSAPNLLPPFKRAFGCSPSTFRIRCLESKHSDHCASQENLSAKMILQLHDALAGTLPSQRAQALVERITNRYALDNV